MVKKVNVLILAILPVCLIAQVDTSGIRYKVGYQVGTWLPFIILAGIFIFMLVMASRRDQKKKFL